MVALPRTSADIPRPNSPLLPTYAYSDNEKAPLDSSPAPFPTSPSDYQPTRVQRLKERYSGLPKVKKIVVALIFAYLGLVLLKTTAKGAMRLAGFRGHRHGHGRGDRKWGMMNDYEEEEPVVSSIPFTFIDSFSEDELSSSTFIDVDVSKAFSLTYPSGSSGVVRVIRSEDDESSVSVASVWPGSIDEAIPAIELSATSRSVDVTLPSLELPVYDVTFTIPSSASFVRSLSVSGAALEFIIDESASAVTFGELNVETATGSINLGDSSPLTVGSGSLISDSGSISGQYNVSKFLLLKSITGDIEAKVSLFKHQCHGKHNGSHHWPHHRNGSHPHWPHHKNGSHPHFPHKNGTHPHPHPHPPHKGPKGPHGPPHKGPKKGPKEPKGEKPNQDESAEYGSRYGRDHRRDFEEEEDRDLQAEFEEMDISDDFESDDFEMLDASEDSDELDGFPKLPDMPKLPKKPKMPEMPKKPKAPEHPKGPKGPPGKGKKHPGPPHHHNHHQHHKGPHGHFNPPVRVLAFTVSGSISLDYLAQPANISLVSKAVSKSGSVSVTHAEGYQGLFKALTKVGSLVLANPEEKVAEIFRELKTPTGALVVGVVHSAGSNFTAPFEGDKMPEDDIVTFEELEEEFEAEAHGGFAPPGGPRGHHGPPPPPHHGHHGPPPPPPPHGPHGPPPKKGPHGPKRHPHGPPPPGHGYSLVMTKVGDVEISL